MNMVPYGIEDRLGGKRLNSTPSSCSTATSSNSERLARNNGVNRYAEGDVLCYCDRRAGNWTSWTWKNPGWRFFNCVQKGRNCGFFKWLDPVQSEEEKEQVVKKLYCENVALRKEVAWLRQRIAEHGALGVENEFREFRGEGAAMSLEVHNGVEVQNVSGWCNVRMFMLGALFAVGLGVFALMLQ